MTMTAWLLALAMTLPVAGLAVLVGRRGPMGSRYWSFALGLAALPLLAAPLLAWLAAQTPVVLQTFSPIWPMAQAEPSLEAVVAPVRPSLVPWVGIIFSAWIVGALARAGFEIGRSVRLLVHTRQCDQASPGLEARVLRVAKSMRVKPAHIYVHTGPVMVTGMVRSSLFLNARAVSSPAFEQIVRHELAHMKRWDVLKLNSARALAIALWFNPFVFAIEARRRLAAELQCDHLALQADQDRSARLYARALIEAARSNSGSSAVVGFGVAPRKAIEMRLKSILAPSAKPASRRTSLRIIAAGLGTLALCGVQAAQATSVFSPPVFTEVILEGRQTSDFGPRVVEGLNVPRFHGGHDIAAPLGTPIRAPAAGTIRYAGDAFRGDGNWGYVVEIDHGGGWTTIYAHLSGSLYGQGDRVEAGQIFATVGNTGLSTGPHLHVEVRENDERRNPADHLPGLARLSD